MKSNLSSSMYREHILDLYKHPLNFGTFENQERVTHRHLENNPLCGDEINVELVVKENRVEDVKFSGKGCAISIASASLVTDKIKGMSVEEIRGMNKDDVLGLLGIDIVPIRLKCALLCLDAVKEALR